MSVKRPRLLIIFVSVVVAAVVVGVYISSNSKPGGDSDTRLFRGCTPEESATEQAYELVPTPTQILPGRLSAEELNRLQREQAGTPFVGRLCDFQIAATEAEALPHQYCKSQTTLLGPEVGRPIVDSELNFSGAAGQVLCDSTPIAAYGVEGIRVYFNDEARVFGYSASREHLRVIDIDGHPALMVLPTIQIQNIKFYVIKRLPSGQSPGILISGAGPTSNFQQAIERARAALAQ